jgi:hypothetical protein
VMMRRYYDAHLYLANWGTRQIMLRLPRTLLIPEIAGQYGVDGHVGVTATPESVIVDLISEDDPGEWAEGSEDSLSAIVGVRSELAAGDLLALYLAWLSVYGGWEWDEGVFGEDDEDEREPPVPAGLGSLTAPQRALADFLRVDADLLAVAAQASPELPEVKEDPGALAAHIAGLPGGEKDRLLMLVGRDQAARATMELLRGLRADPDQGRVAGPGRTVAVLLDAAADLSMEHHRQAEARPLPERPCGNGSAKQPGKGAWTTGQGPGGRLGRGGEADRHQGARAVRRGRHLAGGLAGTCGNWRGATVRPVSSKGASRPCARSTCASPASSLGSTGPGSPRDRSAIRRRARQPALASRMRCHSRMRGVRNNGPSATQIRRAMRWPGV